MRGRRRPAEARRGRRDPRARGRGGRGRGRGHRRARGVRIGHARARAPGERALRGQVPARIGAVASGHRREPRRVGASSPCRCGRSRLHRQGQRPSSLRSVVAHSRSRPRGSRARACLGFDPCGLHRPRGQVGYSDRSDEGEALLDRREHVGPRDRVRCAREPMVVGARGAVHAYACSAGRATRATRDRDRVRTGCTGLARRQGDGPRDVDRRARRARGLLRMGPHRHGREPPRRDQESRGLRVPGVARARARAPGSRGHHART